MNEQPKVQCSECDQPESMGRRSFLMAAGGTAVTLASLEFVPQLAAATTAASVNSSPTLAVAYPGEGRRMGSTSGAVDISWDWNALSNPAVNMPCVS